MDNDTLPDCPLWNSFNIPRPYPEPVPVVDEYWTCAFCGAWNELAVETCAGCGATLKQIAKAFGRDYPPGWVEEGWSNG